MNVIPPKANQFWTLTQQMHTQNLKLTEWLLFQIKVGNAGWMERRTTDGRTLTIPMSPLATIRKATRNSKISKNKSKNRDGNFLVKCFLLVRPKELLREEIGWLTNVGYNSWWHIKHAQHIAAHYPKFEKIWLFRHPPQWYWKEKGPAHMVEGGHHLRKDPKPHRRNAASAELPSLTTSSVGKYPLRRQFPTPIPCAYRHNLSIALGQPLKLPAK